MTLFTTQNRGFEERPRPRQLPLPVLSHLPRAWVFLTHLALPAMHHGRDLSALLPAASPESRTVLGTWGVLLKSREGKSWITVICMQNNATINKS